MTELDQQREDFFTKLHEVFLEKKGFGALAFISLVDAVDLFERYLTSEKSIDLFLRDYVETIKG